jgi:uncharacterized membrane protein
MKIAQEITDKVSIGLSTLCAIHCLVLPLLLLMLPSLVGTQLASEAFHTWMLIAVIPTSLYALTMGCKKHKRLQFLFIGMSGLVLLSSPVFLGHEIVNEFSEKILTLLGAGLMVLAHWKNFSLCKKHQECPCPSENA